MLKDFDLNEWFRRTAQRAIGTVAALRDQWRAMAADARAAQDQFNADMDRAAGIVGIDNLDRMMRGQPPRLQVNVWEDMAARRTPPKPAPEKYVSKPWPGSARDMQIKFNKACEAYVAKHGILALEEALKPPPTPVPVSDPEPPRRPPGKHYR